ncbi:MAG: multiprotein bridging factor aMBF1 [Nitrososphaerales archaeon]
MLRCEVCGNPIYGAVNTVQIDGSTLQVCQNCVRLGKPTRQTKEGSKSPPFKASTPKPVKPEKLLDELELKEDYHKIIKQTREKLGLSQEALGRKINEKPSVIRLLESGKLKPDNMLARKLEHFLKVQLLVPPLEEEL